MTNQPKRGSGTVPQGPTIMKRSQAWLLPHRPIAGPHQFGPQLRDGDGTPKKKGRLRCRKRPKSREETPKEGSDSASEGNGGALPHARI
jgi:hypothetical protein